MPASGTEPFRCWRKLVALRPVQKGGRRSISIAPPPGGMRDRQPPAKGAISRLMSPWRTLTSFFAVGGEPPWSEAALLRTAILQYQSC